MAAPFRQGMQPGMFGAPMLGAMTPQNNEGLGLPGGQAIFNLPRTGNVPGTSVNFPSGQVGGGFGAPSLKMSITRTASSDPVQNIINDISNPLSGANINLAPTAPAQDKPDWRSFGMAPGTTFDKSPFGAGPAAGTHALATSPTTEFTKALAGGGMSADATSALNRMSAYVSPPQFGLRSRMTQAAMSAQNPMQPFTFL